jgi:hypothetical protein
LMCTTTFRFLDLPPRGKKKCQPISICVTHVMNRFKALFRSWAIPCKGQQVYAPRHRSEWLGFRQKEFFENGAAAFQGKSRPDHQTEQQRIEFLEKKIQTKDEVLAELMAEHIALKKSLGEL